MPVINVINNDMNLSIPYFTSEKHFTTPFHIDIINDRLNFTKDDHINDCVDYRGMTLLHFAGMLNKTLAVEKLIESGADIDIKDKQGFTPLKRALLSCKEESALILLQKNAQYDDETFIFAAKNGLTSIVRFFLDNGVNPNTEIERLGTVLSLAASSGSLSCVQLLIENGADVNSAAKSAATPLQEACYNGYIDIVELLLKEGAKTVVDNQGWVRTVNFYIEERTVIKYALKDLPPILAAVFNGHLDIVRSLMGHGVDLNTISTDGLNAVHLTVLRIHSNDLEMLKFLKENNVDFDKIASDFQITVNIIRNPMPYELMGMHPFHIAILTCNDNSSIDSIKFLLTDQSINVFDKNKYTPLHIFALGPCSNDGGSLLLEHGANKEAMTVLGQTPYDISLQNREISKAKLLKNDD